jgi:hypothetical protein
MSIGQEREISYGAGFGGRVTEGPGAGGKVQLKQLDDLPMKGLNMN